MRVKTRPVRIAADERVRGLEIARTRTIEEAEITAQQAIEE